MSQDDDKRERIDYPPACSRSLLGAGAPISSSNHSFCSDTHSTDNRDGGGLAWASELNPLLGWWSCYRPNAVLSSVKIVLFEKKNLKIDITYIKSDLKFLQFCFIRIFLYDGKVIKGFLS